MADSTTQTLRQISIKTGVVKRLAKEVQTYRTERDAQAAVVQRMQNEGKVGEDEWKAKNATKVLKDCEQMIQPAQKRLEQAHAELEDLVDATKEDEAVSSSEQWTAAKALLGSVQPQLQNAAE